MARTLSVGLLLLGLTALPAVAAPVDSDLGAASMGGGCYPAGINPALTDMLVLVDAVDADRLATGNGDGLIHTEWEAGAYPAWAWAGTGDRLIALGRWIFDCGHPDATPGTCSVTTARQCILDKDCRPPTCSG